MSDNERRETHADIIAEMHRFAKQHEYDHPDMDTNARGIEDYADRLEAAHERELAASGNAAKLREALAPFPSLCEWLVENAAKLRERGDKARAALATTAEEGGAK